MSNIFQNNMNDIEMNLDILNYLEDLLEEFDPPADLLNMTTVKLEHTNSSLFNLSGY
jgi:hypothetical protein